MATTPDPPWLDRRRDYPFRSRFVRVEGCDVHYVDEGDGPLLLFLHANPLWSFYFRRVIDALRTSFRCVALDYPGYGLSEAAAGYGFRVEDHARVVAAFVRHLDLTDATLVAHDSGAPIGLRLAGDDPARFQALVLSDCFGWPLSEDPKVARMIRIVSGRVFTFLNESFNLLPRMVVAGGIKGTRLSASERAAYLGPFLDRRRRHVQTRMFRSYVDQAGETYMRDVKRGLAHLREKPALILFGAGDPVTKMRFPEKFAVLLPRGEVVLVTGQDHFPHDGAGTQIAGVIAGWLGTGRRASPSA
jgi:haloalkane dehalogenase